MKIIDKITKCEGPFFSLEFFPPKEQEQWPHFLETVERLKAVDPLFVSVTYGAGGSGSGNTLGIVKRIKEMGLEPMSHLTCVGASSESIKVFLRELDGAGIENILALRGDPPKGQTVVTVGGDFTHAADLVRYLRRVRPGMGGAGAGYPAPHPESPSFVKDRAWTVEKIRTGADFVMTQLFFDVREYFDFVDSLRMQGLNIPVIPGILPIQSLDSFRRVLSLCGANIPASLYFTLEEAHKQGGAEAVKEAGFTYAVKQIKALLDGGAPGIHLYTLNKASLCLKVVEAVRGA